MFASGLALLVRRRRLGDHAIEARRAPSRRDRLDDDDTGGAVGQLKRSVIGGRRDVRRFAIRSGRHRARDRSPFAPATGLLRRQVEHPSGDDGAALQSQVEEPRPPERRPLPPARRPGARRRTANGPRPPLRAEMRRRRRSSSTTAFATSARDGSPDSHRLRLRHRNRAHGRPADGLPVESHDLSRDRLDRRGLRRRTRAPPGPGPVRASDRRHGVKRTR